MAGYYPWFSPDSFGPGKISDMPLNPYNSDDPAVIARNVAEAKETGIDGFASAWLAPDEPRTNGNFAKLLAASVGTSFRSCPAIQTSFYKNKSQASFVNALKYVVQTYGNHPNFLKVNGRPVIFFTDMPRVPGGGQTAQEAQEAWRQIRSQVDPGNNQIWIAEGLDPSYLAIFDGLYVIKISHQAYPDDYLKLPRWGNQVRQWAAQLGTPKIWAATIMPGWDDTLTAGEPEQLRDPWPAHKKDREGGVFYRATFEKALESRPDWIYIHSFNEWVEGAQIEPSRSYQKQYLELTREFSQKFKSS